MSAHGYSIGYRYGRSYESLRQGGDGRPLLKCLWVPAATTGFLECFESLVASYQPSRVVESHAAALLPALLLARVDGKSPVEYLTEDAPKERVRRFARPRIATSPDTLTEVSEAWRASLR